MKKVGSYAICVLFLLSFASAANASVECLSGKAAQAAFTDDKSEPYFSLLEPREMAAKTGVSLKAGSLKVQREEVRKIYREAVQECSPAELLGLESYLQIIDSALKPAYPALVALPWRIVKVSNGIEGGLPHTRGTVIVLPERMIKVISETSHMEQWRLGMMQILIHEQVHVLQRTEPQLFASLYRQWGFHKASTITGAEQWLSQHQIINPDGIDVMWVWPVPGTHRMIWPRVILTGEASQPEMPRDIRMVGIELRSTEQGYAVVTDKQGTPEFHDLREESAYMERFAGISSLYHPNEIAADYLAALALWDTLADKSKVPAEQQAEMERLFKTMRLWAQQNLAH